ncbi:hypothetical protein HQ312_02575 [Rhodococcus sp. BP-316]|uniref:hypothetical protein n=1 Tax=Rhodococcus sp. BP-316 TaxID=2739445 RepID=UPI001C9A8611|nr:hypothetical protein [Rhodococcus sp. BP-316]MBY6679927.1 hypothetical protein [Rhodococcus sp. BP-316]
MSDTEAAPADLHTVGIDTTGWWWVIAPDGAVAYRFGPRHSDRRAALAAAQAADEGRGIGVPAFGGPVPEVRPGDEAVDVPMRGDDLLDDTAAETVTRAAADGWDARLWNPGR